MNISFIIRLFVLSVFGGIGYYFLLPYLPVKLQYHHFLFIILFFIAATTAFHLGLTKSLASGSKQFIRYYMAATGLKLLLYIAMIVLYATVNKAGLMAFAFCFLLFYLLFTVLEVATSYKEFGNSIQTGTSENQPKV